MAGRPYRGRPFPRFDDDDDDDSISISADWIRIQLLQVARFARIVCNIHSFIRSLNHYLLSKVASRENQRYQDITPHITSTDCYVFN